MDFFIVGTSRTGSTLLRDMLDLRPDVGVLNESHWVPRMWQTYGSAEAPFEELMAIVTRTHWDSGRRVVDVNLELAGSTWDGLVEGLRARVGARSSVGGFHDALVDVLFGADRGSIRRGDKTPDYGYYARILQRLWPKARFVHVVRNGIDTARSMARHPGCQLMISAGYDNWVPLSHDRVFERYERRALPFGAFVASWRRRMARIRDEAAALEEGSYLEIRYEKLVTEPEAVIRRVADHLGLAASSSWLAQCARLVRPRSVDTPMAVDTFRGLTPEDLVALNEVGGVPFLLVPPNADLRRLESELDAAEAVQARGGRGDEVIRAALGVLSTRTAGSNRGLGVRATALLREALAGTGRDADLWTGLAEASVSHDG